MRSSYLTGIVVLTVALFVGGAVAQTSAPRFKIDRTEPPKVGATLEDFQLQDMDGNVVKLSQFRGKSIFVFELGACT